MMGSSLQFIMSQQCVVYQFKCGLCDMDCNRHFRQRVAEHSSPNSKTDKHMHDMHGMSKLKLDKKFSILKKNASTNLGLQCRSLQKYACTAGYNKFDCLIHGMLIIQDIKPTFKVQTNSIRAKLCT